MGKHLSMLSIPYKQNIGRSDDVTLIIYYSSKHSVYALSKLSVIENEIKHVEIESLTHDLYYSIDLDKKNRIGNVKVLNELPINSLSQLERYSRPLVNQHREQSDCGSLSFGNCIRCLASACAQSWACTAIWGHALAAPTWVALAAYGCSR